ncbi:sigma-70 family RNA polymerase sigma factor [Gynuella sp.]|uniref:sigma-70 family RNA polymerase sigma factor n=1 Tax=Gynuella sp. TaxID=2969146 RepID=UPI003D0BB1F1
MPATRDTQVERELWQQFMQQRDTGNRHRLMKHYRPASVIIAKHLYKLYGSDISELDDYIQEAQIALHDSIERYQPDSGAEFMTYANYRIRGQILNSLKHTSERASFYDYQKKLKKARSQSVLSDLDQDNASFHNIGESIIRLAYIELVDAIFESEPETSANAPIIDDNDEAASSQSATTPYQSCAIDNIKAKLKSRLQSLPAPQKQIIELHYYGQLGFEEIGQLLGLSKTRISQLHKQAILTLQNSEQTERSV